MAPRPSRRESAALLAVALLATSLAPPAAAQTPSYIYTGQTGAQTQIDVNHKTTWTINVASGTTLLFGGGQITMKRGSATTATATFACYNGTSATGTPFASVTLGPSSFTGSYQQIAFPFSPAQNLVAGSYFCQLTSTSPDTQSQAYFIKGYGSSIVSTNGSTTTPGTTTTTTAGLNIVKSAPATAVASGNLAYTFQLGNSGTSAFSTGTVVYMQDQLPAGVAATGSTVGTGVSAVSCTPLNQAGALLTCAITLSSRLAPATDPSTGPTFTVNTNAPATAGTITNYAAVNPTGSNTGIVNPVGCTASYCWQASTVISATASASLSLTKSCPQNAVVNVAMTCTLTFTNVGTGTLSSGAAVQLLDALPSGVTYVANSATPVTNLATVTCNSGLSPMACTANTNAALAPGASASFTIQLTPSTVSSTTTNFASVSPDGTTTPQTPGAGCTTPDCSNSVTNVSGTSAPALSLSKTSPNSALIGGQYSYSLVITNTGTAPLAAGSVALKDLLPTGVTFVSAAPSTGLTGASCGAAGQTGLISCTATLGSPLAVGGTATMTITVTAPTTEGGVTNYASVSADGTTPPQTPGTSCTTSDCSAVSTNIRSAALSLTKSGAATAAADSTYQYTLSISNSGTASIPGGSTVQVADLLPAGAVYQSAGNGAGTVSASCTGTTTLACGVVVGVNGIPIGSTAQFTITVKMPSTAGPAQNYASTSPNGLAPPTPPGPACNPAIYPECGSFTTTVTPAPGPALTLTKTGPAYAVVGTSMTYVLTIKNEGSGPVAAGTSFPVAEAMPSGATLVSATAASPLVAGPVTCSGSPLICTVTAGSGGLAAGASATLTLVVTAPSTASTTANYASVSPDGGTTPAPQPGPSCLTPNCASLPQTFDPAPSPELTLTKSSYPTAVINGQIVYTMTIQNSGTGPLAAGTAIQVADLLPAGVTYTGANDVSGVQNTVCTGTATLACTATLTAPLAVGSTAVFEIVCTAPPTPGATTNYGSVSETGTSTPPTPGPSCTTPQCSNADVVYVTPVVAPVLALSKTGPATVTAGQPVAYTITITNQGTAPLGAGTTFAVRDRLPAGATLVSTTPGPGIQSVACTGTTSLACPTTLSQVLAVGGTASFTLTMTAPTGVSSYVNYASVSIDGQRNAPTAGPACLQSNCALAPATVNAPALSLAKTGPASGVTGGPATFVLTVTNSGSSPVAAGATIPVLDQLPAGATFVSAAPGSGIASVSCTGTSLLTCSPVVGSGGLAIGATASFSVTMTLPAGSSSVNYAAVSPDGLTAPPTPGPTCASPSCASSTTNLAAPVLALGKTGPATAVPGGQARYELTISNSGTVAAPGGIPVAVLDQLPAGATFVSASAGVGVASVSCTGTLLVSCGVTLASGGLAPGATAVFYITAKMPSPFDGLLSNIASVSIDGVTPPVDPATACAGLGRRRLLCSTCACAGCKTDVYDPNDPAAVLKRKVATTAAAVRKAKVETQQEKLGLFDAVANKTETKLAAVNPTLEAEVASVLNEIGAVKKADAAQSLGLYDALTNKTLTVLDNASTKKWPIDPTVAAAGGAGTTAAANKLGALAKDAADAINDVERLKAADVKGAQRLFSAAFNKTLTAAGTKVGVPDLGKLGL